MSKSPSHASPAQNLIPGSWTCAKVILLRMDRRIVMTGKKLVFLQVEVNENGRGIESFKAFVEGNQTFFGEQFFLEIKQEKDSSWTTRVLRKDTDQDGISIPNILYKQIESTGRASKTAAMKGVCSNWRMVIQSYRLLLKWTTMTELCNASYYGPCNEYWRMMEDDHDKRHML